MATWDMWSGAQRLIGHGRRQPDDRYHCAVCGLVFDRWRAATEHICADQRKWRRYHRAVWRSVRNNRRRRRSWYTRRMAREGSSRAPSRSSQDP